jgi:predicted kinase
MHLIIFTGIPGSGKSTFYQQHFFHSHLRVNLDMLRTRNRENRLLRFCFDTQMPLVVDNTNVKAVDRQQYIQLAKQYRFRITGYYFHTPLPDCLARNALRTGRQRVDEKGVRAKYYQLEQPSPDEGFDELFRVTIVEDAFDVTPWQYTI